MAMGPRTLAGFKLAEIEVQREENAGKREFRRGQLKALGDVMHVLNLAVGNCRLLRLNTAQLEEVREAIRVMLLGV